MKAAQLVPFAGRAVVVTFEDGRIVRGRLSRRGAEIFVVNRSVHAANETWEDGGNLDLSNVIDIAEEEALFGHDR